MSFVFSKILWVFLSPGNGLILLLLAGVFLSLSQNKKRQDLGLKLSFCVAFLLFFIALFPVGDWALAPLENRFPPAKLDHVDGIILLGGDEKPRLTEERGQMVALESSRRYIMFATLAHQYPQAKRVYTGGSALLADRNDAAKNMKEADLVKQALSSIGVPVETMVFEGASRNTYENAFNTAAIIHPVPQEKWLLVTSAWHMPRSIGCFRKAGWNVFPAPTDYRTSGTLSWMPEFSFIEHLEGLTLAAHEYSGLVSYWLMGRMDKVWP